MVSRFDIEYEYDIWNDEDNSNNIFQITNTEIKPDKVTSTRAEITKADSPNKRDIYKQLGNFIRSWEGKTSVLYDELFSLYQIYCNENNETRLIDTAKSFKGRIRYFVNNKTLKRNLLKGKSYYFKSTAINVLEMNMAGKKRKEREDEGEEYVPKKKRRIENLTTWNSSKEIEEFALKISIQESQIKSLCDICRQQKELIDQLMAKANSS